LERLAGCADRSPMQVLDEVEHLVTDGGFIRPSRKAASQCRRLPQSVKPVAIQTAASSQTSAKSGVTTLAAPLRSE
jgi:hypothetical protein